jgi:hypothetical protein
MRISSTTIIVGNLNHRHAMNQRHLDKHVKRHRTASVA